MRSLFNISRLLCFLSILATCFQCGVEEAVSDTQKTAALRKVTITSDSGQTEIQLPEGALSGRSFAELAADDPAAFTNPANYAITFILNMTADNRQEGAEDAKFDGMTVDMVMDTIVSTPVRTEAGAFEVKKNTTHAFQATGTINLQTHRRVGLYIFRQTVDGNDLATTLSPVLNYKIGSQAGTIDLPDIQQNIPTRASAEMKAFLSGLLDSGVFEETP
jgi:hypothetical protein